MQILNCLKNKEGFSLLECILAIAILSAVLASLMALQSSIVFVAQNSIDKLKAVWAMKQANAQLKYLLDKGGFTSFNENSSFVWPGDARFKVEIKKKSLNDVKPSQFLITALKFYNMTNPSGDDHTDVNSSMAVIAKILDSAPVSQNTNGENASAAAVDSFFVNVFITVNWMAGSETRSFSNGFFLIDTNSLSNIQLPDLPTSGQNEGDGGSGNNNNNLPSNSTGQKQ